MKKCKWLSEKPAFYLCVLSFTILLFSCNTEVKTSKEKVYFFDSRAYFDLWTEKYTQSDLTLTKSISETGEPTEEKEFSMKEMDWRKELALFYESNINKAALKNLYSIDTIRKDTIQLIQFNALDSSLGVRRIDLLYFPNEEHPAFAAEMKTNNMLYESDALLYFHPFKRYSVQMNQRIKHSDIQRKYTITGKMY